MFLFLAGLYLSLKIDFNSIRFTQNTSSLIYLFFSCYCCVTHSKNDYYNRGEEEEKKKKDEQNLYFELIIYN